MDLHQAFSVAAGGVTDVESPPRNSRIRSEESSNSSGERLASRIARVVHKRTGGRIRELRVEVSRERVRLYGACSTYYTKQLAQHAAMCFSPGGTLINDIEVV